MPLEFVRPTLDSASPCTLEGRPPTLTFVQHGDYPMTPLRQRFIDDLRLRNFSAKTIKAYVAGVVRFARHFRRSPAELGTEDIRSFQIHLLQQRATWSLYNQTVCALRFLYGVTLGRPDVVHAIPYGKKPKTL